MLRLGATTFEDSFDIIEHLGFPSGNGVRIDVELCRELADRFVLPMCGEGGFRFGCRRMSDTFFDHKGVIESVLK